jgi:hypothetical protein
MRVSTPLIVLAAALLLTSPVTATSAVPDPFNSSVPQCLLGCPAGDFTITIVVRDLAANPVAGSVVQLHFDACTAFNVCPPLSTDGYTWTSGTRVISAITDATGTVRLKLRAGGVCGTANGVSVYADGVLLANRTFASPDQNGDLFVNAVDQGIANAKLGAADATADFDCDGVVTAADLGVVAAHQGHSCEGPTPTHRSTWGSVKILYR